MVARTETDAGSHGMTVRSPDRIRSKITGRLREVDASIRYRVGSAEVLITLECRRQKKTQNVIWIEQSLSKRTAIGADCTIAVSSSGFSNGARKRAEQSGISLRELSEVSIVDINSILCLNFMQFWD